MRAIWLTMSAVLLSAMLAAGQTTKLRLSSVIPGSEKAQLVYNGDFEFKGPMQSNTWPLPDGWARQAEMFVGPGTNTVLADTGSVAGAFTTVGSSVCKYERTVTLLPATDYVLSAYVWNFGDAANHVNANVDLNDVPQDPQLTLGYSDSGAAAGCFLYRGFNTTNSGTNVTVRVFYDGLAGVGAAAAYFPLAAQWDNISITPAADFLPPAASGSGANLRPVIRIVSPPNGTNLILDSPPPALPFTVAASDYDGSVALVELFSGATKLGQSTASPFTLFWTNPVPGAWQVTARATDNLGATTVSAPVAGLIAVMPQPVALSIARSGTNAVVSWPASATASGLQAKSNYTGAAWALATNAPALSNDQNTVALPTQAAQQFFRLGPEVDASTLTGKLMMGYQGWFACPGDASPLNQWVHWFRNNSPYATNLTVDFWPDVAELGPDELFATGMTLTNGSRAKLYSAYNQKTVLRHFKWMKDNHLDGVFLQRFSSSLSSAGNAAFRNQVTANVGIGAGTYGRVFAIMYDISGQNASTLVSTLTNDWAFLVNTLQVTNSPNYIRHRGKPVVAIWGFGFTDRPGTPDDAQTVIGFFKSAGCTVMGGVPTYWRTLKNDSQTNIAWAAAYRAFDIISPWAVGRYTNLTGADTFRANQIAPDLAETQSLGIDYMPVIWPGFSWHNLKGDPSPLNQIPRNGGTFYWRQAYNAVDAGCTMIYGAMFDEVDEGTAMYKLAATTNALPVEGAFVPLNTDGYTNLPSDWYLRLADQAGKMLRGEIPRQSQMPLTPQ